MKHTYFLVLISFLFATTSFGQKILKTNSGQRILLVDNGSWRLLSPLESVDESIDEASTSLDAFDSPKQGKNEISPDQRLELETLLTNFLSDEAQLCVNLEMSRRKSTQLQKEFEAAKKEKKDAQNLKEKFNTSKEKIKKEESYYNSIGSLIEQTKKILKGKEKNPLKSIVSIKQKFDTLELLNSGMGGAVESTDGIITSETNVPVEKTIEKKYPTTFKIDDRFDSKQDADCELVFDGYDSDIGKDRKEVKTQAFFSYSQEKMKPYFKNEDFLTCDANISKIGKKYYLTLKIRIRSKDANKSYGLLRVNENIKIEMINGQRVYGRNINNDKGKIESYTGHTLYTGVYELNKDDINDLKKHYLDHIGIIWSSGYEQYDIYNVDFLTNQLQCLTK